MTSESKRNSQIWRNFIHDDKIHLYVYDSHRFHLSIKNGNNILTVWYLNNKQVGALIDGDILNFNEKNFVDSQIEMIDWLIANKLTRFINRSYGLIAITQENNALFNTDMVPQSIKEVILGIRAMKDDEIQTDWITHQFISA